MNGIDRFSSVIGGSGEESLSTPREFVRRETDGERSFDTFMRPTISREAESPQSQKPKNLEAEASEARDGQSLSEKGKSTTDEATSVASVRSLQQSYALTARKSSRENLLQSSRDEGSVESRLLQFGRSIEHSSGAMEAPKVSGQPISKERRSGTIKDDRTTEDDLVGKLPEQMELSYVEREAVERFPVMDDAEREADISLVSAKFSDSHRSSELLAEEEKGNWRQRIDNQEVKVSLDERLSRTGMPGASQPPRMQEELSVSQPLHDSPHALVRPESEGSFVFRSLRADSQNTLGPLFNGAASGEESVQVQPHLRNVRFTSAEGEASSQRGDSPVGNTPSARNLFTNTASATADNPVNLNIFGRGAFLAGGALSDTAQESRVALNNPTASADEAGVVRSGIPQVAASQTSPFVTGVHSSKLSKDADQRNPDRHSRPAGQEKLEGITRSASAILGKHLGETKEKEANLASSPVLSDTAPVLQPVGSESSSITAASFAPHLSAQMGGAAKPAEAAFSSSNYNDVQEVYRQVLHAGERMKTDNRSHVEVQLRLQDGTDLRIRMEWSDGSLKPTFITDSQALKTALDKEWAHFTAHAQERGLQILPVSFQGTEHSGEHRGGRDGSAHTAWSFENQHQSSREGKDPSSSDEADLLGFGAPVAAPKTESNLSTTQTTDSTGGARQGRLSLFA